MKTNSNKFWQYLAITFTCLAIAYSYLIALVCSNLSFDGSFNLQAALSLIESGTAKLNYLPIQSLQTGIPFQLINGLILTLTKSSHYFYHAANLFFIIYFAVVLYLLCKKINAFAPLYIFSGIICHPHFSITGYSGLGEFPAFCFLFHGAYLLSFSEKKPEKIYGSAFIFGLAIATKLMAGLCLPAIILTVAKTGIKGKQLFSFLGIIIVTIGAICGWQYYPNLIDSLEKLSTAIFFQSSHVAKIGTPDYLTFVQQKISTYLITSKKLYWHLDLLGAALTLTTLWSFIREKTLDSLKLLYLFTLTSYFSIITFFIFFNRVIWYRRFIIACWLTVIVGGIFISVSKRKYLKILIFPFIILLFLSLPTSYTRIKSGLKAPAYQTTATLTKKLELLPKNYVGFVQGWFHAPFLSHLAKKPFINIYQHNVLYDCIESECNNYFFYEFLPGELAEFNNYLIPTFDLKKLFLKGKYGIYQIQGFNRHKKFQKRLINKPWLEHENSSRSGLTATRRFNTYSSFPVYNLENLFALDIRIGDRQVLTNYEINNCWDQQPIKIGFKGKIEETKLTYDKKQLIYEIDHSTKTNQGFYFLVKDQFSNHCTEKDKEQGPLITRIYVK